ncbi:MAG TPA: glycosyltransferase family 2 protein [Candidatus Didemnitutus sp.]|jgi:glycosyltransferase involved in cell wall biosynthesis
MTTAPKIPVSVAILTLNEERHLPACLASLAGCDDVVVVDSGSTDRTVELARAAGARVFLHPFHDFASQRNHAMEAIEYAHPFVFHLDADELVTPELLAECAGVASATTADGFYVAPRMMFDGVWLRHCTDFPAWQARFVRRDRFRFIQVGHGQREAPEMKMGYLQSNYLHDISVPDPAAWEQKHRRYAAEEAAQFLADDRANDFAWRALWAGPPLARRRAVKHLSYRLPARAWLRFVYQYYWRRGFLDGAAARRYCRLLARYEAFTVAEIRRQRTVHPGAAS